jgi:hypothetical protein
MNKMTLHELTESAGWRSFTDKVEKLGALVLLSGLVLEVLKLMSDNAGILLVCGFSSLALVYFFKGFTELKPTVALSNSFFKIYGWGLAISCVACMFTLNHWPIHKNSMVISMVLVVVSLLLGLKMRSEENKELIDTFYFLRLFVALAILCIIYFHPGLALGQLTP